LRRIISLVIRSCSIDGWEAWELEVDFQKVAWRRQATAKSRKDIMGRWL